MRVLFVVEFDRCSAVVASETVIVVAFVAAGNFVAGLVVEVVAFLPTIGLDDVSNLHYTC